MSTIIVEDVKKTKKNEPKVFPSILTVDKEAFGKIDDQVFILKTFWKSSCNKIIVARKSDTKAIVGYACYLEMDGGCYLMRIAVRAKCQRGGIGRKLMNFLFSKYKYLSLEVSTDNLKAVSFYTRIGLEKTEVYHSKEKVEFAKFETPQTFQFIEQEIPHFEKQNQIVQEQIQNLNEKQTSQAQNINEVLSVQEDKDSPKKFIESDIDTQSTYSAYSENKVNQNYQNLLNNVNMQLVLDDGDNFPLEENKKYIEEQQHQIEGINFSLQNDFTLINKNTTNTTTLIQDQQNCV